MPTLINALNCNKSLQGTGLVPCEIRLGRITSVLRVSPTWSFNPATETFNLAYVISKIQDGTFTPFLKTLEFLNNTPDPTTKEYQSGAIAVIRNGKPQRSLEYDNGIGWHKSAYSYNGFRQNSVIEIDASGNVAVQNNVAGTLLNAWPTNMFNTRTYVPQVGDDNAKTLIEYQISNEEAYNKQMTIITAEQIGADLNEEVMGIIGVNIVGTAAAADPIEVTVTAVNNTIYGIEALTEPNFRVVNVATNAVVPLDTVTAGATPGTYSLTPTTPTIAAQTLRVEMYDSVAGVATALIEPNQLYKGVSATITVTA